MGLFIQRSAQRSRYCRYWTAKALFLETP